MRIGVIGGSGVYHMDGLEDVREERVETPYGAPSDALIHGRLAGVDLVFLPRHGRGHRLNPSEVNYRANVFALKQAGCRWVISVSAVGSLREEIVPGHVVLVDQFIDRTHRRASTFFEQGVVAHVAFGDPVCPVLRGYLLEAAREAGAVAHDGGTYVCMEGPQFSTRAESNLHRSWGASVIGMTNMPEAKLAREAEMSYATLAMATDYDCWHPDHDAVTVDQVVAVLTANSALAKQIVARAVRRVAVHAEPTAAHTALRHAVLTAPDAIPAERRRALAPLLGAHLPE
jgi:5'-methylthioadenosine phosphorylase